MRFSIWVLSSRAGSEVKREVVATIEADTDRQAAQAWFREDRKRDWCSVSREGEPPGMLFARWIIDPRWR
jgi:hypothetical protein